MFLLFPFPSRQHTANQSGRISRFIPRTRVTKQKQKHRERAALLDHASRCGCCRRWIPDGCPRPPKETRYSSRTGGPLHAPLRKFSGRDSCRSIHSPTT
ncbi:hypothetical protein B0T14DRAFT_530014 [Immersiella caudata]|uniref:Uncharacterized protein n=1 Tax=Immersiella caudata TaxID=314043 RepID=A0AA39TXP8_9PEZI|nr:hypothetical protein B0T14DRAFT_530014 [Immersiella caudata]